MDEKYVDVKNLLNLVDISVDILGNSCLTIQGFNEETVNKIKETSSTRSRGTET